MSALFFTFFRFVGNMRIQYIYYSYRRRRWVEKEIVIDFVCIIRSCGIDDDNTAGGGGGGDGG